MTKWGDRPHWAFAGRYLGDDDYGDWLGIAAGSAFERPGATYTSPVPQVTLVPHPGLLDQAPAAGSAATWLATFHCPTTAPPPCRSAPIDVYVDLAAHTRWLATTLVSVDLDLDVVRGRTGRVWVDDEEEFAKHRAVFGYPEDLVGDVLRLCDEVRAAAEDRLPPFDGGTSQLWLERLRALTDRG